MLDKEQLDKRIEGQRHRGIGYLLWPAVVPFGFKTRLKSLELVTTEADAPPLLFDLDSAANAISDLGDNIIDA